MNIVVVAQEAAGVQTVRLVEQSSHHLVAVLTSDHLGTDHRGVTVSAIAHELGAPVLPSEHVRDPSFAAELRRWDVDVLLNVHSLHLIDLHVLAAPRIGTFNLHPGPLPAYAGLNVPSWAIYRGKAEHGATLHWVVPRVDAGPIAFESKFSISPQDSGLSLSLKCVHHGLPLTSRLLTLLTESPDDIPEIEQDTTQRRYFGRDIPYHGWIPWNSTAEQVIDFVRACDYGPWPSPWKSPRTRSMRTGAEIDVLRASRTRESANASPGTVVRANADCALVAAADEWVLVPRVRVNGTSVRPTQVLVSGDLMEAS